MFSRNTIGSCVCSIAYATLGESLRDFPKENLGSACKGLKNIGVKLERLFEKKYLGRAYIGLENTCCWSLWRLSRKKEYLKVIGLSIKPTGVVTGRSLG